MHSAIWPPSTLKDFQEQFKDLPPEALDTLFMHASSHVERSTKNGEAYLLLESECDGSLYVTTLILYFEQRNAHRVITSFSGHCYTLALPSAGEPWQGEDGQ